MGLAFDDMWVCVPTCSWATLLTAKYCENLVTALSARRWVGTEGAGCPFPLGHHGVRKCCLWKLELAEL